MPNHCPILKKTYPILLLLSILINHNTLGNNGIWIGGGLGTAFPNNLFTDNSKIGFFDVAQPGFIVNANSKWFYNVQLSLGAEISLANFNQKKTFWNVANYGDIDGNYLIASILLNGQYYFGHKNVRPYAGMAFGAYYLNNKLNFISANQTSDDNKSVNYITHEWKPGFAPELGLLIELSRRAFLDINARFTLIPDVKPKTINITSSEGYLIDYIVQNPHADQNHLSLLLGLIFRI